MYSDAVFAADKLFVTGGYNNLGISRTADVFDTRTGSWSVSRMLEPKSGHTSVAAGSQVFWIGGLTYSVQNRASCNVEIRNAAAGGSTPANLSERGSWTTFSLSKAVYSGDHIVVYSYSDRLNRSFIDIYNLRTRAWSVGQLPFKIDLASLVVHNNDIYLAGGIVNGNVSSAVWKLSF